jgi:hypothetical protein
MVPNEIAREKPALQGADNDIHKGAMEEDRPGPEGSNHAGLDQNGLPNDPVAIAEDAIGARADQSQG